MLISLKSKILIPVISVVALSIASIFIVVSLSTANLIDYYENDRMHRAAQMIRSHLDSLQHQAFLAASAVAGSQYLAEYINNGDREGVIRYLQQRKGPIGIDAFIIAAADGHTLARSHVPDFYGDFIGGIPHVAAALQGRALTAYALTPTVPLVITSTSGIFYYDNLIGGLVANIDIGLNSFVDNLKQIFSLDFTVFEGGTSIASTLTHPETGARAVGTVAAQHILQTVIEGGENLILELNIFGLLPYRAYYFPLRGVDGSIIGMFFVGVSQQEAINRQMALQRNFIFIIIFGLLAAIIVVFFIVTNISKSLRFLVSSLEDVASGEADMTKRIPEGTKDEIGRISRLFNKTMAKFEGLIILIKKETLALNDVTEGLAVDMNNTTKLIDRTAKDVRLVRSKVNDQDKRLDAVGNGTNALSGNINSLSGYVKAQSNVVNNSSSAIEELLANIRSVTDTLVKNSNNVKELSLAADSGRTGLQNVAADIQEIAKESEGLLEINAVMENISSQTNLLSMNAAIEAAHAGESGKGFAVVAGEIRKLAESSSAQSKSIGAVLKKIKTSIDKITGSTNTVLDRFEVIDRGVKTVANQEEEILRAMEEQKQGSNQVLEAIAELNDITDKVKSGTEEMAVSSGNMIKESRSLDTITREIIDFVSHLDEITDEIEIQAKHINELIVNNGTSVGILASEVHRFKTS